MFIVVGMADDPLLVCPQCADTVLRLSPKGQPVAEERGAESDQLTMFE